MKKDDMTSRLRRFREALNVNQATFAREIGIPRTTLINYEKGTVIPSEILLPMRDKYRLNIDWFLTGKGPMFTDSIQGRKDFEDKGNYDLEPIEHVKLGKTAEKALVSQQNGEVAYVNFFPQTVGAGPGQHVQEYYEVSKIPVIRKFIAPWKPEEIRAIEARGDSMTEIGLFPGDIVLYTPKQKDGDGVFVICIEEGLQVKRIEFDLLGEKMTVISENKRYNPVVIPKEKMQFVKIEGRVVGWLHRHPY